VTAEERSVVMCVWNAIIVFISMLYLVGGVLKSAIVAGIILISSLIGYGRRWLLPLGFAGMYLAGTVAIGVLPPPEQWLPLLNDTRAFVMTLVR